MAINKNNKFIKLAALRCRVNGRAVQKMVETGKRLLDFLRSDLRLTGTKEGCGDGECGACTVLLDGRPVNACMVMALQAAGRSVVTIEGISPDPRILHPLQQGFIDQGGVQCGFCIPGMIMSCAALLEKNPQADLEAIKAGMSGNLCRCTGYEKIFRAVEQARRELELKNAQR